MQLMWQSWAVSQGLLVPEPQCEPVTYLCSLRQCQNQVYHQLACLASLCVFSPITPWRRFTVCSLISRDFSYNNVWSFFPQQLLNAAQSCIRKKRRFSIRNFIPKQWARKQERVRGWGFMDALRPCLYGDEFWKENWTSALRKWVCVFITVDVWLLQVNSWALIPLWGAIQPCSSTSDGLKSGNQRQGFCWGFVDSAPLLLPLPSDAWSRKQQRWWKL